MRNVSDKNYRGNPWKSIHKYLFKILALCEIMWTNGVKPDRQQIPV
jgi:hypothetical protein